MYCIQSDSKTKTKILAVLNYILVQFIFQKSANYLLYH